MTAKQLLEFRARHRLSQTQLCALIGLEWNDRRTVTRMEEGRARLTPAQERALMLWEAEREANEVAA